MVLKSITLKCFTGFLHDGSMTFCLSQTMKMPAMAVDGMKISFVTKGRFQPSILVLFSVLQGFFLYQSAEAQEPANPPQPGMLWED